MPYGEGEFGLLLESRPSRRTGNCAIARRRRASANFARPSGQSIWVAVDRARVVRFSRRTDADVLDLSKLVQSFASTGAAGAAVFVSAVGTLWREVAVAVDPGGSGGESAGDAVGAAAPLLRSLFAVR
jgi:hypothetical protein